jgi:hypothetical protein
MRTIARFAALAAAALSMPQSAWAKSDEQVWATGSATVKLSEKWLISEEVVIRVSDARSGLYEVESNTLLNYRPRENLTVAAGYTHDPQYAGGQFTVMEHRAREQVTFNDLARLAGGKLSARIRLEQRWREGVDGTGWRVRPYLKFSLPLQGSAALNLSSEPFLNLNTTPFQRSDGLDRMRNLVSVSTPLSKKLSGEVGYMNQYGFVRGGPDTIDHVVYIGVSLSL